MKNIIIALFCSFIIFACSKDDVSIADLSIDKTTVDIYSGSNSEINITSGNGNYQTSSSNEQIATASISGNVIKINGKSAGTAKINVTDSQSKSIQITVNVQESPITSNTERLEWKGEKIEYIAGIQIYSDYGDNSEVSFINVISNKSISLHWDGKNNSTGIKTNAKLVINTNGDIQTIILDKLDLAKIENGMYWALFEKDNNKGVVVSVVTP